MSADPDRDKDQSANRLLIIDGDTELGQALGQHFKTQGYDVQTAGSGEEGLILAQSTPPHLILLAAQIGLDIFHALRARSRTAHIPVMVIAGHNEAALQKEVLEAGAYDFIEKPLDLDILALRIRNALRRAEREGLTESRTGLPTGRLIDDRLNALAGQVGWFRLDVEITGFDVFRDLYGFVTANEALRFAGNLLGEIVNEHGAPDDFVGHRTGSEEFVIVTTQALGPRLNQVLTQRISQELHSFYNFMEREQGYVLIEDGAGGKIQKPLMAARITVTQGDPDPEADPWVDVVDENHAAKPDDSPGDESSDSESSGPAFDW
ncbi:MAG: response regulator [Anaerolineae bacterium]|nr:response regulator [Anaerolineae bacterium]